MEQTRATDNNGNVKLKKQNKNIQKKRNQPSFGICFDVDGVLARGTIPLDAGKKAFTKLVDANNDLKVPVTFVTNALNRNCDKAKQIEGWMGTQIRPEQMIQAQGPLEIFTKYHDKFCLVIGQGKIQEIAKELGFKNICSIQDVADAYPLLDMVDHDNRKKIAASTEVSNKEMPRIEAIILMGEPKRWESSLQLIIDLLRTDGKPDQPVEAMPEEHLPVIACNMDLQFMDRACMPRYGHGAYLLCLEALYKKVIGRELKYTALIGKPSEITFRYAEHCLAREAKRLGYDEPLKHMYLIGDTPEVDIVGSNLYQRYIDRLHEQTSNDNNNKVDESDKENKSSIIDSSLPESRNIPRGSNLTRQSAEKIISILVSTGVYKPGVGPEPWADEEEEKQFYHGHRDFPKINELYKPTKKCDNVDEAIDYILQQEKMTVQ